MHEQRREPHTANKTTSKHRIKLINIAYLSVSTTLHYLVHTRFIPEATMSSYKKESKSNSTNKESDEEKAVGIARASLISHMKNRILLESNGDPQAYARSMEELKSTFVCLKNRVNNGETMTDISNTLDCPCDYATVSAPAPPGLVNPKEKPMAFSIPYLLGIMQKGNSYFKIASAANTLGHVIIEDEDKLVEAWDAGGPEVVISVMKEWCHRSQEDSLGEIQLIGLVLLQRLSDMKKAKTAALRKLGFMEAATNASKTFLASAPLQKVALITLATMVVEKPAGVRFIHEYDGIEVVLASMNRHPKNEEVVENACLIFAVLALNVKNHPALGANPHVGVLMQVMSLKFPDHDRIQEATSSFMYNMFE